MEGLGGAVSIVRVCQNAGYCTWVNGQWQIQANFLWISESNVPGAGCAWDAMSSDAGCELEGGASDIQFHAIISQSNSSSSGSGVIMKKILFPLLVVIAAMFGVVEYWKWQEEQSNSVELPPIVKRIPELVTPTEPRYPIPSTLLDAEQAAAQIDESAEQSAELSGTQPEPLPPLNESSAELTEGFSGLFAEAWMPDLFRLDEVIRRFVVTIDNLTNKKLPRQHLLVKPVAWSFLVSGEGDDRVISAENAARYAPYVRLATRVDTQQLVAFYVRYYPLFQEAYAELGQPNAYFNDRLIEVIDHLLMAPSIDAPIGLVQPKVFLEYADPELQALSAGQKVLLRMGATNAEQIKLKLREVRQALTQE